MATSKPTRKGSAKRVPKVRIVRPGDRPFQLRYSDPESGKEVRISVGSRDEAEAEEQKADLEAKLRLGIESKPRKRVRSPQMHWEDFREAYRSMHLATLSRKSVECAESRLDLIERIAKPKRLIDLSDTETLHVLQAKLLEGAESRYNRPRSPFSVKTYMANVLATLNWAYKQGWLELPPRFKKLKTSKLKHMKGRALTTEEFERMLAKTESVVGTQATPSWHYLLRGLWESALRLDELMHLSWDDQSQIRPEWKRGRLPVLVIPSNRQKNATDESIPLLSWFEAVLMETPLSSRTGWIFNPMSLETNRGHVIRFERPSTMWVGKIISKIGKKAGIIVSPKDERTGRPAKFASAHDLRRSCSERMLDAGVPPLVISRVLRHASWETTRRHYAAGDVQKDAGILRDCLISQSTLRHMYDAEAT